ncbi:MAG: hypothetical protein ACQES1_01655 [Bacteroidota bacterium]
MFSIEISCDGFTKLIYANGGGIDIFAVINNFPEKYVEARK